MYIIASYVVAVIVSNCKKSASLLPTTTMDTNLLLKRYTNMGFAHHTIALKATIQGIYTIFLYKALVTSYALKLSFLSHIPRLQFEEHNHQFCLIFHGYNFIALKTKD